MCTCVRHVYVCGQHVNDMYIHVFNFIHSDSDMKFSLLSQINKVGKLHNFVLMNYHDYIVQRNSSILKCHKGCALPSYLDTTPPPVIYIP